MTRDDLAGVDDHIAERALARRAVLRAPNTPPRFSRRFRLPCARRFMHPREPAPQYDRRGFPWLVVDTCACLLAPDHVSGCVCAHGVEHWTRVADDGHVYHEMRPVHGR